MMRRLSISGLWTSGPIHLELWLTARPALIYQNLRLIIAEIGRKKCV